ncbi:transketolase [Nitrospirillum pindoramense]|uniref:Pyruvate dehydrogenase E1 component n=1 Tax=Nitrospirillum amazonense TaxID=28077 RepID=A0A560H897_9PROT|nr:transketolase [Nitrospirillum amazonense]TWB42557.1 pyruvate dehydrogenase E1 component [Nitrospirillum amazonense]
MPDASTVSATHPDKIRLLEALERKVLWLSAWTIHNANHIRPSRDGLKVGGHQASSASLASIMTALYFDVLRPQDRVAVKPHASPVFHAIQYMLGRQTREKLERFRALGGAQSYPSRTKDTDDVDFSTGSVGLGVAVTAFASLVQDYVRLKGLSDQPEGRMVALVGDAEMDEGNVFEAMLEGWKHDLRNTWWIIDYNRQSLDSVVSDRLWVPIEGMFRSLDWNVQILKYGKKLQAAFAQEGGDALRQWIDTCPNQLYSALTFKGGAAWREALSRDLGDTRGIRHILDAHDDAALGGLMTNLAGHDLPTLLETFHGTTDDRPACFIAYTVKGRGLPFQGHKDNHAGLMNPEQMAAFKVACGLAEGQEWDRHAGLDVDPGDLDAFLAQVPFAQGTGPKGASRRLKSAAIPVPSTLAVDLGARMSTQEGFGKILGEIAKGDDDLAARIVTTSPDVTVSTNLGPWVNRRGLFARQETQDIFREQKVVSAQRWQGAPGGQHIELGIAEHNLFLMLAALGLSHDLFGARLLPIGTLYDPFIKRGLDAMNYAAYQDARFMVVATPSGVTLAPEGGAHQSIVTPLIGMGLPNVSSYEPAFVDELAAIMAWGFDHMQRPDGGSLYLRLSTRQVDQPRRGESGGLDRDAVIQGGYWLRPPAPDAEFAIVYCGALAPEALEAHAQVLEDCPGAGLLAVTSPDRLHAGWTAAQRQGRGWDAHVHHLLSALPPDARLVTVIDGHPATLSWLGSVRGQAVAALGVEKFGQSADIPDLYQAQGLDADAIVDACARVLLG